MKGQYHDLLEKHGTMTEASRAAGIPRTTFRRRYNQESEERSSVAPAVPRKPVAKQRAATTTPHVQAISEKELLSTYDPYERARTSMEIIPSLIQPGAFIKDLEIRKAIGLTSDPRLFRELAEDPDMGLLDYQFFIGRGVKEILCWTDPETKQRILEDYPLTTRDVTRKEA